MTEEKIPREVERWKVLLREAYERREKELTEIYHRSLPFQDAMFDREERGWRRIHRLDWVIGISPSLERR